MNTPSIMQGVADTPSFVAVITRIISPVILFRMICPCLNGGLTPKGM